ncbi:MAG TPA: hypothetical protein VHD36_13435, partial [Pirellulales bacterium]|nr:hypothetical protein [Pirellulales bacterium]
MSTVGRLTEDVELIEQQKVYLELAKLSLKSFQHRREYEWKVAFGLWTAIGLFTYFIVKEGAYIDRGWLACGYVFSGFVWFICWQLPMRRGFDLDQEFKHYYMALAAGEKRDKPDLSSAFAVFASVDSFLRNRTSPVHDADRFSRQSHRQGGSPCVLLLRSS